VSLTDVLECMATVLSTTLADFSLFALHHGPMVNVALL